MSLKQHMPGMQRSFLSTVDLKIIPGGNIIFGFRYEYRQMRRGMEAHHLLSAKSCSYPWSKSERVKHTWHMWNWYKSSLKGAYQLLNLLVLSWVLNGCFAIVHVWSTFTRSYYCAGAGVGGSGTRRPRRTWAQRSRHHTHAGDSGWWWSAASSEAEEQEEEEEERIRSSDS